MKQLLIILSLVLGCLQPGYTQKPVLKFNKDGKFKIVQFTDVHYIHGNPKSAVSLERINEVLDAEKPDLVLFTGDVIYGQPAEEGMRTILNLAANRQIPFGVTFGNHDDEQGLTRTQLFDIIQTIPYNLTDSVAGVTGVTNFILPLKSSDGKKDAAILYCMDSHSYSQIKGIGGYDYIKFDQIRWYRENSAKYTKQNGGTPLPSLAFFHIALPEYNQAASDEVGALLERADAHHEELVQIGAVDGQKLELFGQRDIFILAQHQHAAVEVQPAQFPVDKNALFTHDNSFFPRRSPLSAHIGEALPFVYHILRNARHLCHLIEALEPAMGKTMFQNGSRLLLPEAGQCGHSVHPGGIEIYAEGLPQRLDHH